MKSAASATAVVSSLALLPILVAGLTFPPPSLSSPRGTDNAASLRSTVPSLRVSGLDFVVAGRHTGHQLAGGCSVSCLEQTCGSFDLGCLCSGGNSTYHPVSHCIDESCLSTEYSSARSWVDSVCSSSSPGSGFAGVSLGIPTSSFRSDSSGATGSSLSKRRGGCEAGNKTCGEHCIPDDGVCCEPGQGIYCQSGNECCGDNFCNPVGTQCCSENHYCGSGQSCCHDGCVETGSTCCAADQQVCGTGCIAQDEVCCDNGDKYCAAGQSCTSDGNCCDGDKKVCGSGCVGADQTCCPNQETFCPSDKQCCNDSCIAQDEACCTGGQKACGNKCIDSDGSCDDGATESSVTSFTVISTTVVIASQSKPTTTATTSPATPTYQWSGDLLSSDCTTTAYTLVDTGNTMYYVPMVGCNADRLECCPWAATLATEVDAGQYAGFPEPASAVQNALPYCPDDYYSISGSCCLSNYVPFTDAFLGMTLAVSSFSPTATPPTLTVPSGSTDQGKPTSAVVNMAWAMQYEVQGTTAGAETGNAEGGQGGLSTGAKAGIGVGVTLGVLLILGLIAFFMWKRRTTQNVHEPARHAHPAEATPSPQMFRAVDDDDDDDRNNRWSQQLPIQHPPPLEPKQTSHWGGSTMSSDSYAKTPVSNDGNALFPPPPAAHRGFDQVPFEQQQEARQRQPLPQPPPPPPPQSQPGYYYSPLQEPERYIPSPSPPPEETYSPPRQQRSMADQGGFRPQKQQSEVQWPFSN